MPNVHLTKPMQDYADRLIKSGAYANLSEVVRAGMRGLMERDGARQFYALKAELKRPAQNLNRVDSHAHDFVIHSFWEDGSCQHLCQRRFGRGFSDILRKG